VETFQLPQIVAQVQESWQEVLAFQEMEKILREEEGTCLRKQTDKQTKACSCQLQHTILTPTVSFKSGTHAFLTWQMASDAKLPWMRQFSPCLILKASSVLYNGSQHNLLGKLISRANNQKKKEENLWFFKSEWNLAAKLALTLALPFSSLIKKSHGTNNNTLRVNFYSSKACQPFCAWQLCFRKLLFIYLSISWWVY